jgi:hypothetical protein
MRRAVGAVLAALAICAAGPGGAAAAEPRAVEEVELSLPKTVRGHDHFLQLDLSPLKGMAVVQTVIESAHGLGFGVGRGVSYAVAIPSVPFDGSLDLTVPGLGEFVGTVSTKGEGGARCRSGVAVEGGTFAGRLDFRGAGGYESWKATRVRASLTRSCAPVTAKAATPDDLFLAVQEYGPTLSGPASFRFLARSRKHTVDFIAWGDPYRDEGITQFVAIDREWLPGGVVAQRWVNRPGIPSAQTVAIGPGGDEPSTIDFRPPAPFFGSGRYHRRSHALTGSLGVSFLGRRLRLARPPLVATLEDEAPGRLAGRVG